MLGQMDVREAGELRARLPRRWSSSPGSCPCSCPSWWTTTPSAWIRSSRQRRKPRPRTRTPFQRASPSRSWGCGWDLRLGCPGRAGSAPADGLACRFLQEQRMACEVGLYYVLHVTKQRNKNALLRLLPGLGECAHLWARPLPPPSSSGVILGQKAGAQLCTLTDA